MNVRTWTGNLAASVLSNTHLEREGGERGAFRGLNPTEWTFNKLILTYELFFL